MLKDGFVCMCVSLCVSVCVCAWSVVVSYPDPTDVNSIA